MTHRPIFSPKTSPSVQRITAGMLTGLAALTMHVQEASAQGDAASSQPAPTSQPAPSSQPELTDEQLQDEVASLEKEVASQDAAIEEAKTCEKAMKSAAKKKAKVKACQDLERLSRERAGSAARLKHARKKEAAHKRRHHMHQESSNKSTTSSP